MTNDVQFAEQLGNFSTDVDFWAEFDIVVKKQVTSYYWELYTNELRRILHKASMAEILVCRAWHGNTFGLPGHGGVDFVVEQTAKARLAIKAVRELFTIAYICAGCSSFAYTMLHSIDSGTTLTCDKCGGKTVVDLATQEQYKARFNVARTHDPSSGL